MNFEAELEHLKRRVDDLEGAVSVLSGYLRSGHPELLALKGETSRRFDLADSQMARIVQRLDFMNTQVWSLRDDLPSLLRQAIDGGPHKPIGNDP